MERLKKTDRYLDLSEYGIREKFDVYELGEYDFSENLDFGEISAVYIFSKRDYLSHLNKFYKKEMYMHTIIYCGMTGNTNQRFYNHFQKDELNARSVNRICICECSNRSDAKNLEKKLLKAFKFPINEKDNDSPEYPDVTKVWEVF